MSDKRTEAIKTLEDMINIYERHKKQGSITRAIVFDTEIVESLRFALESLKADASDKTDRGEAITTLTEHLDHWKRLLSEGICCEVEGKQTINALTFAIESIKVDRAYDLDYEKVDFIEIPEGATLGDMIKAVFPNAECNEHKEEEFVRVWIGFCAIEFPIGVWNSPYRKEQE